MLAGSGVTAFRFVREGGRGHGRRTLRIPRRRGSPGVGTGAGGHGPRPFPATWDTSPPPFSGLAQREASRVRGAQTLRDSEREIRKVVSSRSSGIRLPAASRSAAPCQPSGRRYCSVGTKASGLGVEGCPVPALSRPHSGHLARDGCAPSQRFPRPGTLKARLFDIAPLDSLSLTVLWSRTSLIRQTIWKGILRTQVEFPLCNTEILRSLSFQQWDSRF